MLTRKQMDQIREVWRAYETEVEQSARSAITGYMQRDQKPSDMDQTIFWANEDFAVIGDSHNQPINTDDIERRLDILTQDDNFYNDFYRYAQKLPDDTTLTDADQTLRLMAFDRVEGELKAWFSREWPEVDA